MQTNMYTLCDPTSLQKILQYAIVEKNCNS